MDKNHGGFKIVINENSEELEGLTGNHYSSIFFNSTRNFVSNRVCFVIQFHT